MHFPCSLSLPPLSLPLSLPISLPPLSPLSPHLSPPSLPSGLAVVGWCGHDLDGASFEKVRSVLVRTEEEKVVEILVKECR